MEAILTIRLLLPTAMLFKHDKSHIDLSLELADEIDWQAGTLRHVRHHLDITAFATEPVSGLLAVGASLRLAIANETLTSPL